MNPRHGRLPETLSATLALLTLGACGGGGAADPDLGAAFKSSDTERAITRAFLVELDRDLEDEPASLWMDGIAVSFDEAIDTDTLLRSVDAPLSLLAAASPEGCLLIDDLAEIDRLERSLLDGAADERGETVLLSTPAGSLGELTLVAGRHDENAVLVRPADLPDGTRVAVAGGEVAFDGVAVPRLAPPSGFTLTGFDPATHDPMDEGTLPKLRSDSELRWRIDEDDDALMSFVSATAFDADESTDPDGATTFTFELVALVGCIVETPGRFVFPPGARAWMEARSFESDPGQWGVSRAGWNVVREGDTALVVTHSQQFGPEALDGIDTD